MLSIAGSKNIPTSSLTMVSILVPVYNTAKYLQKCVDSLTGQTYSDLQIVLIDDGSTDDSWEIMKSLAKTDKRIEVYSQSNRGVAATRNQLLEKSRGDFVLFVDSDDWIDLNTIEILLKKQQEDDYDIVVFQMKGSFIHDENHYNQDQIIKLFLEHIVFTGSLCNKLVRGCLYDKIRIDENVSYGEDALLMWQVLLSVKNVATIDKQLYYYRINEQSISHQVFNGNKCTAYTTWDRICRDIDTLWPQYHDLAHARFACEMAKILRDGIIGGFDDKASIMVLQDEIRKDGTLIYKTRVSSRKMQLFAFVVSRNYWLAKQFKRFL